MCSFFLKGKHFFLSLVFFTLFTFGFNRVKTNFFVILLKSSQIFTGFREFSFFHTFSYVPMDKGTFGIHKIKLMIKTSPSLSDGSGVGQHADGTLNLGKITTRDNGWRLVIDTNFEASGTPIHKLDGTLGLDGGDSSIDILGDNVASVEETTSHVFTMTGITFHHLVGRLKASICDLSNRKLFMVSLFRRDDRGICDQGEMDSWVR